MNHKGAKSDEHSNDLKVLESPKTIVLNGESDGEDESESLLHSKKVGGLSKKLEKPRRKVQWLDNNGDKLAEILEFQPSDESGSDDDESDSCICRIM
ncbi:hypothetical protein ACJIZ3_017083 [Penstemon smallii]|uniref:Uncharacterized protein n=1 Tax=Penstemon smallii TaxID=265156 RepID=A0ABD3SVA5_9LAMI